MNLKPGDGGRISRSRGGGGGEGMPPGWSKHWSKSRNAHYYFNKVGPLVP